jgi:TnpA family transposase
MRSLCFQEIGETGARACAAAQPVLTRYKLLEIERRWYAYPEERRRFLRQLNKGEALHDLRAFLMVANKGQLHQSRGEALTHQALCLNLVTNAVIVWHTVYMAAVVEQLKQEGYPVQESDLAHVWPTRYAHMVVF